ncbi:hypothetical protein tinsulaeT_30030 [Thalassotalea insulae]|uniref:Uncharacterized protein n=1 Tax=Thalassotalea insulae TaxID=2056778 RepID=A0ABQ6GUS3_9GAMM|nr:hypothetical protein [Thalassotalea insulae]GLX79663.1 hypothetical protein tinsulaeT_30030 [Thalassotalea insulae]
MTEQTSLWQDETQSADFAELCSALYEREIAQLANADIQSPQVIQGRLKSLPYYIKRTAHLMLQTQTPLDLDVQNASWSAKQAAHMPLSGQEIAEVNKWYLAQTLTHGLVVPVATTTHIVLDSIDRIDQQNHRFRTNVHGWFYLNDTEQKDKKVNANYRLLKPNKRVMTAACTGHCWVNDHKTNPVIPSLRELLLSCAINWRNFKQPVIF